MVRALFGVREGNEDWQEELITEVEEHIPAARKWAESNGFDRLRVVEIDDTRPPDFAASVNPVR